MHKNNVNNVFCARSKFLFNFDMLRAFLLQRNNHSSSLHHKPFQTIKLQNVAILAQKNSVPHFKKQKWGKTFLGSYKLILVVLLILLQAGNQSIAQAQSVRTETFQTAMSQSENAEGEIIVVLYQDLNRSSPLEITDIVENSAVSVIEELDLSGIGDFITPNGETEENQGLLSIQSGQLIRVPLGSEAEIVAQLSENPLVALAIPNRIVRASGAPVEAIQASPYFKQYAPKNASAQSMQSVAASSTVTDEINDPYYPSQWYMDRIEMLQAWALTLQDDDSSIQMHEVKVAVIDSGIDHLHPEFTGRIVDGENYFDLGSQPVDDYGHGSHVSGLIGASVNNGIGIAGVAPFVKIMPYKTLDGDGNGTISNVTQAIRDATDAGAQIINLSLETGAPDPLMKAAIDYAVSNNVVLIASVGNLAPASVRWPAFYDEVIGVAATDEQDQHADYSCQGAEVELAAPGGTNTMPIRSTWSSFAECPGVTDVDPAIGAYCYARGTSMSTGLVSGAAAIILGIQPELSAEQVRAHLIDSAIPLLSQETTKIGNGLLNVHDAARHAVTSELQVSTVSNIKVLQEGSSPYLVTIVMTNPSSEPVTWRTSWLERSWMVSATPLSGEVAYENPDTLQFMITPTSLEPSFYNSVVTVVGTRIDGSQITHRVAINIVIEEDELSSSTPTPTWTPPASTARPQATATPLPTSTPAPTTLALETTQPPSPTSEAVETQTPESTLAFDVNYNVTELILKRSDEPYRLIITINNDEVEKVSWQLSLAPSNPQGQNWLSSPEVLTGDVSPQASNQVILMIDPLRLAAGEYETELNVSAQGESTTRTQSISTNISLLIEAGEFQVLLPTIIR